MRHIAFPIKGKQPFLALICLLCLFVAFPLSVHAQTAPTSAQGVTLSPIQMATNQYQSISQNGIEQAWQQLANQYGGFLPSTPDGKWVPSFFPGKNGFSIGKMLIGLLHFFFGVLMDNGRLLGAVLLLTVLASILETIQTAFASQMVSKTAFFMVYLVISVLAVSSFHSATSYASGAMGNMTGMMMGSMPVFLALVTASGGLTSAAAFHPLIIFIVNLTSYVIDHLVFPLIFFTTVLLMVSQISSQYKLTQLAGLIRTVLLTVLGLGMTAFLGVMSVQGSLSGLADGVTLKSAKFIASNLIPVVGKAVSDATESIAGATLLMKNATGIAGAVLVLLICAFPALKILALSMIYNGAAAVMQPLGDTPVISLLGIIGKSLTLVFASLSAVGIMFFFTIVIMLATTNLSAFVR